MSTIRPDFHSSMVARVLDDIFYRKANFFYFLGKIDAWDNEGLPPAAPLNTSEQDNIIRDNILYMKKVAPTEASLVVASKVWSPGTVYDQWDHTVEMQGRPFYCITADFNVYKCLNNNRGALSTVAPAGNSLAPFYTSDGYMWKYMYNVPPFKRRNFNSIAFMPVQKAITDSFYSKGAVEQVVVTDGGSGYVDASPTTLTVTGATTGSGATAVVSGVDTLGQITAITVINPGSGYTKGARVLFDSSGTGAEVYITNTGGAVDGFTIVNGGYGYSISDPVILATGGAVITPIISHTTGEFLDVIIENPGAGYDFDSSPISITQFPIQGSGKFGNATAVLKAIAYQGSIVHVSIEDPGQNYPADVTTTISIIAGDGADAAFTPVVRNGEVVDVIIDNAGTGYTYIDLQVVGTGIGATLSTALLTSDFTSDQSIVEQTAVTGAIYNIAVDSGGTKYSPQTTIEIVGDGTGATCVPVIVDEVLTKITMTSFGSGYTYANAVINDPTRYDSPLFVDAVTHVILPPANGHGFDAVKELYADTLAIYTLLKNSTELNLLSQDYRQYGLIRDPNELLTNKKVTTDVNILTFKVTMSSTAGMSQDDILVNGYTRFRVVSIDGADVNLQQLSYVYNLPNGIFYKEDSPEVQYTIQQVVSIPTVNKYSGSLMYLTNSASFTPTDDQSILIRTYIKL